METLPHELIIQILLRLPVKFLIRFKCVCKLWFSLISSTHFANSQFQLTAATHTHRALFIVVTVSPHQTRSIDLEALDSIEDDSAFDSLNPSNFLPSYPYSYSLIDIKGSCRGFIFLTFKYIIFYIWNPSTGVHKNIPLFPRGFNLYDAYYGFGYDPSTDDYLVVLMLACTNSSRLEFFSLRANRWKQIDDDNHIDHYSNGTGDYRKVGLLFNGAIHWFAYCLDIEKDVIVAFDLMERKLLDMHLPDQFDLQIDYYSGLWVFREFLSLWAMDYENDSVEIWVMKEYKVHSSWIKTHALPIYDIPNRYFFPLCCTKSGDIVGTDGYNLLVKYNDVGQLLWTRRYFNQPLIRSRVVIYSESLLSLAEDNVQT